MKALSLSFTLLTAILAACAVDSSDSEALNNTAVDAYQPFYVAVFDHQPTDNELEADFARFSASMPDGSVAQLNPTGSITPQMGQKLVRIDATASNISNAQTDDTAHVRFMGTWLASNLQLFTESFVLNNPNVDDLDRNTVSVFYYLVNVRQQIPDLTQDRFVEGWITNSSEDGWHCNNIVITERNFRGMPLRSQSLPFAQWVKFPSHTPSSTVVGNDDRWLGYY